MEFAALPAIGFKKRTKGALMMGIRTLLSAVACALAAVTISSGAMAQGPTSMPSSGSLAFTAIGIGLAVYIAHRIRKK